jgi:hypothetical protein
MPLTDPRDVPPGILPSLTPTTQPVAAEPRPDLTPPAPPLTRAATGVAGMFSPAAAQPAVPTPPAQFPTEMPAETPSLRTPSFTPLTDTLAGLTTQTQPSPTSPRVSDPTPPDWTPQEAEGRSYDRLNTDERPEWAKRAEHRIQMMKDRYGGRPLPAGLENQIFQMHRQQAGHPAPPPSMSEADHARSFITTPGGPTREYIEQGVQAFRRGEVNAVGSIVGLASPERGAAIQKYAEENYASPNSIANTIAGGAGGVAPGVVASLINPAAGYFVGGAQGAGQGRLEAREQRLAHPDAPMSGLAEAGLAGAQAAIGVAGQHVRMKGLPFLSHAAGDSVAGTLAKNLIGNEVDSVAMNAANNLASKVTGADPDREILHGTKEAAISGIGAALAFTPNALHERAKLIQQARVAGEQQQQRSAVGVDQYNRDLADQQQQYGRTAPLDVEQHVAGEEAPQPTPADTRYDVQVGDQVRSGKIVGTDGQNLQVHFDGDEQPTAVPAESVIGYSEVQPDAGTQAESEPQRAVQPDQTQPVDQGEQPTQPEQPARSRAGADHAAPGTSPSGRSSRRPTATTCGRSRTTSPRSTAERHPQSRRSPPRRRRRSSFSSSAASWASTRGSSARPTANLA